MHSAKCMQLFFFASPLFVVDDHDNNPPYILLCGLTCFRDRSTTKEYVSSHTETQYCMHRLQ